MFRNLLQDARPTVLSPTVLEVDIKDIATLRTSLLPLINDLPALLRYEEGAEDVVAPDDVWDGIQLAEKWDAPDLANLASLYARAAPYGIDTIKAIETEDEELITDMRPREYISHRAEAFTLGARLNDTIMCARLIEQNGGSDEYSVTACCVVCTEDGRYETPVSDRYSEDNDE